MLHPVTLIASLSSFGCRYRSDVHAQRHGKTLQSCAAEEARTSHYHWRRLSWSVGRGPLQRGPACGGKRLTKPKGVVPWKPIEGEEQAAASPHMGQERACALSVKGISYSIRRLKKNKICVCRLLFLCLQAVCGTNLLQCLAGRRKV